MSNKRLSIAVLAASLAFASIAHAQGVDPVQYIVAPETPGPNAPVTITVQGVGAFLGNADVTWTLNGTPARSGVGESAFSFSTGALGSQTVVGLTIDSATQGFIEHTFVFTPSTVDLVWEADTSMPPLYKSRALYSAGSSLKVVAFPTVIIQGKRVSAQSLSYQWQVDGTPVPDASGTGKFSLTYPGNQLQAAEDVSVDVYFGSLKVGHAEIGIPVFNPKLLLYYRDPLRGVMWDEALPAAISLAGKEITVQAQPYFFSNESLLSGAFTWSWSLNGQAISGPQSDQGLLTLRQSGDGKGSASLAVSLQNQDGTKLLQAAQAALTLLFGQTASQSSSLFGL